MYELYGLTPEDVREVTLWYCRRYPALAAAQGVAAAVDAEHADYLAHAQTLLKRPLAFWREHPLYRRLAAHETHTQELKAFLALDPDGRPQGKPGFKVARAVASLANADGGSVFIGVKDNGEINGIADEIAQSPGRSWDGFERKLRDLLENYLQPVPAGVAVIRHTLPPPDGEVCEVVVPVSSPTIYCLTPPDGPEVARAQWPQRLYVRDGNRTLTKDGAELERWLSARLPRGA